MKDDKNLLGYHFDMVDLWPVILILTFHAKAFWQHFYIFHSFVIK